MSVSQLWFSFTPQGFRVQHFPNCFYFVIVAPKVSVVKLSLRNAGLQRVCLFSISISLCFYFYYFFLFVFNMEMCVMTLPKERKGIKYISNQLTKEFPL